MRVNIEASSEVNTIISVEIPINPKGDIKAQVSNYMDKYYDELAEQVKENLIRNFNSDWKENLMLRCVLT